MAKNFCKYVHYKGFFEVVQLLFLKQRILDKKELPFYKIVVYNLDIKKSKSEAAFMDIQTLYKEKSAVVLGELTQSLGKVDAAQVGKLIDMINSSEKIFFIGVGRVMTSLQMIAKRLKHIGYDTYIVGETTEPPISDKDLLIVGSGSGATLWPSAIAKKAKTFGAKVAHIGAIPDNPLVGTADLFVRIPVKSKKPMADVVSSKQPMTTLFEQSLLLLGDTMTLMILEQKGVEVTENMWAYHANLE